MLIDTHTHLYLDDFSTDKKEVVQKALNEGVGKLIFPNVDFATVEQMKRLHAAFPFQTYMAMGLHPTEVKDDWKERLEEIERELNENASDYIAVGEVGIDLYWDKTFVAEQIKAFERQTKWAVDKDLALIIHCREGLEETLSVLSSMPVKPKAVFHSFGGSPEDVEKIKAVGDFYFGINGVVTFKNSRLDLSLPYIGLDRIVLETDSPYLAPVPFRGKRNESSYLPLIAGKIADILNVSVEEVCDTTTRNAQNLFGI